MFLCSSLRFLFLDQHCLWLNAVTRGTNQETNPGFCFQRIDSTTPMAISGSQDMQDAHVCFSFAPNFWKTWIFAKLMRRPRSYEIPGVKVDTNPSAPVPEGLHKVPVSLLFSTPDTCNNSCTLWAFLDSACSSKSCHMQQYQLTKLTRNRLYRSLWQ